MQREIFKNMSTTVKKEKAFDTVVFFRAVKEKIARATEGMTLQQRRDFFHKIREGDIQLA